MRPNPPQPAGRGAARDDTTTADGGAPDMIDVLIADHRAIERIFTELTAATPATMAEATRRDLVDVMIAELMRHTVAEEQYLYPTVRRYLPSGDRLADQELAEHARIEDLLSDLVGRGPTDSLFERLVTAVTDEARRHIRAEEDQLFPGLRVAVDHSTLVNLGTDLLSAKKLAPTRPHPASPHHPPLNKVTAPVLGLLDQAADSLTDRPTTIEELRD